MTDDTVQSKHFDGEDLGVGSDGLPIREVGRWSKQKHHFLKRYIDAFTTAMKGKPHWAGLGYVDLFAGPGMCRLRETGEEFDGSPLLALDSAKPFDAFVFADKSKDALEAVRERFGLQNATASPCCFDGDSNENIQEIAAALSSGWLYLAFLDPTGLDIHFETVRTLTKSRRVDLIISIMDRIDLVRNVRETYYHNRPSKLDMFLGEGVDWRKEFDSLAVQDAAHVSELFLKLYQEQLQSIGYRCFGQPRRISGSGPLYLLFFASKHEMGRSIWDNTSSTDSDGQRSFRFQ